MYSIQCPRRTSFFIFDMTTEFLKSIIIIIIISDYRTLVDRNGVAWFRTVDNESERVNPTTEARQMVRSKGIEIDQPYSAVLFDFRTCVCRWLIPSDQNNRNQ